MDRHVVDDQKPTFSILTPAYNAEQTIERCLHSVACQTLGDYEHIIVDDGSIDDTASMVSEYLRRDPRIKLIKVPHGGVARARNTAMEASRGEFLVRLDADDQLAPCYLEKVLATFGAWPETDIVSTNGYQVLADGTKVFYYTDPLLQKPSSLTLEDMLKGHMFGTSAVIRKHIFDLTGGARPETYSEDPDLWLRAIALGAKHRHLPEPVFLYHQDQAPSKRVTGNTRALWKSHIEILDNLLSGSEFRLTQEERKLAKKRISGYKLRLLLRWDAWGAPLRVWMMRRRSRNG